VEECNLLDVSCSSQCSCDEGYRGLSCGDTETNFNMKVSLRESALNYLAAMSQIEEPSTSSVSNWIGSVAEATRQPVELSYASIDLVLDVFDNIFSSIEKTSIPNEATLSILDSINAVIESTIGLQDSNRRLIENYFRYDSTAKYIENFRRIRISLESYGKSVLDDLVSGEESQSQSLANVRSFLAVIPADEATAMTITSLLSEEEEALSIIAPQISLPALDGATSVTKISAFFVQASLFGLPDLLSNPVVLNMYSIPASYLDNTNITFVLPLVQDYRRLSIYSNGEEVIRTRCLGGNVRSTTFLCSSGYNVSADCNGTAGVVEMICPSPSQAPDCLGVR
jgi:hypothetical protein